MVRSGVWLEESVVPYVAVSTACRPLNAYLYDFFKHENVQQLENANGIRRGDMWYLLNDFSMVLATITTNLESFSNPHGSTDMDMLNVAGSGDFNCFEAEHNIADENNRPNNETTSTRPARSLHSKTVQPPSLSQLRGTPPDQIAENWEDEMADAMDLKSTYRPRSGAKSVLNTDSLPTQDKHLKEPLDLVSKAFQQLKKEFDNKFLSMWA
ncbi:hypothetical protein N7523_005543 [Penicillium sp. IBT 18751x]|nr:hypothetical protein N7523_005871 [Penicillium sp. IBT 18751x]KAJ6117792.1 hypothetical protein N7523_005543 [Penicillium sp. IBT 18751x]